MEYSPDQLGYLNTVLICFNCVICIHSLLIPFKFWDTLLDHQNVRIIFFLFKGCLLPLILFVLIIPDKYLYYTGCVFWYLWQVNRWFFHILYGHGNLGTTVPVVYYDVLDNWFTFIHEIFCMFLFTKIKDLVFKFGLWRF